MKITGNGILNLSAVLEKLASRETTFATAVAIAENIKKITTPRNILDTKRAELSNKYIERDDNNQPIINNNIPQWKDEYAYVEKMNELLNEEIEIEFVPIDSSKLENMSLSAFDILVLSEVGIVEME